MDVVVVVVMVMMMMMIDNLQRTLYRVFILSTVACHFLQLKAVALVDGRVSGYIDTINELTGSGSRRL